MAGKSPVAATDDQKAALKALAGGSDRAEADRARAILLTLGGWTSARIAEAFGVREDTVRLWRSDFMSGGVDALKASVAPGPVPVKAAAALKLSDHFFLPRSRTEQTGRWPALPRRSQPARRSQSPDRSSPRCCVKKGVPLASAAAHAERTSGPRRHRSCWFEAQAA